MPLPLFRLNKQEQEASNDWNQEWQRIHYYKPDENNPMIILQTITCYQRKDPTWQIGQISIKTLTTETHSGKSRRPQKRTVRISNLA